jgi:hypothetical protein
MAFVIAAFAAGCSSAQRPDRPIGPAPEYEPPRQFDLPGSEPAEAPKRPEGEAAGSAP